jgi:hypothetical protein
VNEKYVKTETMQPTVGTTGSQNRAENPRCATCGAVATCFGAYDGRAEAHACDACCGHGGEDGYCVAVGESKAPAVDLEPWRRLRCKVCPANCVREDGHHGQHRDAAGNLWDYGHCTQCPLAMTCERCRSDEHPIAGRKTTAPKARPRKPEQLSLF